MFDGKGSRNLGYTSAIAAVVLGLYLSSLHSYLLFHSLIEIVTIAIAFTLFILTWNARRYLANGYLRLLGIGYGFIALIDLLHTLAYKGMSIFPGYGANLPTQLWIAARYLQAITLITAPLLVENKLSNRAILGLYATADSVLLWMVYSGNFADCFVEGQGLTAFKIGSEYLITAVLLLSLYLLYRKREYFERRVFYLAALSIAFTAVSEMSFTAYVSVYGFANLLGHFAKLAAFYLIYRAVLVTGIQEPFELIFRDLKQAEASLLKSQETLEEKVRERTAELHASEQRYRSLIEKVQAAIVLHDGQGRVLNGNPMAQELLGLSEDQLLGRSLIDPDWHFLREDGSVLPVAEYPVSLVLSTRRPLRGYLIGISHPERGGVTWVLVNADPEYDDAGEMVRIIVSFVDISERKRNEEALHRLNRELRAVRDCNQVLVRAEDEQSLLNDICRIVCDEAGYRMAWVGYPENDDAKSVRPVAWAGTETGYLQHAQLTWADTEQGRGPAGTAIRTGTSACIEDFSSDPKATPWRDTALQRGYRSSIALPLKDESANTFGVLNIYSTQANAFTADERRLLEELAGDLGFGLTVLRARVGRKQAELALSLREREYRTLVQNIPDLIVRYDTDLRRTYVNPAWESASGLSVGDVVDVPMADMPKGTNPVDDEYVAKLRRVLETGTHQAIEFNWVNARGVTLYLQYLLVPEFDRNGRVASVLAVGHDITKRRQAEEEIHRLNQELEQRVVERTAQLEVANKELEAFAYSVSHDLRAPLRHIDGFVSLLKKKSAAGADEQSRHYMDTISAAARRMGTLIDDLLSFSRMGRAEMTRTEIELGELVQEVIKEFEPETKGRAVDWRVEALPVINGDRAMLRMVLMNLISNALKFTQPRERAQIEVGCLPEQATETVVFVRDNGVGFDMQYAGKLFGVFQRLHGVEEFEGTGIGLANVRRVISRHGGRTWAEGKVDGGATFYFTLPQATGGQLSG